jgi:hypothetical protein
MIVDGTMASPADQLLAWLSARGRASRPTVERACRAIAERFDLPPLGADRSPSHRLVEPLRRIGHVEAVPGGLVVVPTTLCWASQPGRGILIGARDRFLLDGLHQHLGSRFIESQLGARWPSTWGVDGDRDMISAKVATLGIVPVHEPGIRLLCSLPTLEEAIASWPDDGPPPAASAWEVLTDPGRGRWNPADGVWVEDGLVRRRRRRRGTWVIVRGGVGRLLVSPEMRAVAWWAELARQGRRRLSYRDGAGLLVLPPSLLPPPTMVERPLIWASGEPPRCDTSMRRTYRAIEPERAGEIARILGLGREDAS